MKKGLERRSQNKSIIKVAKIVEKVRNGEKR